MNRRAGALDISPVTGWAASHKPLAVYCGETPRQGPSRQTMEIAR